MKTNGETKSAGRNRRLRKTWVFLLSSFVLGILTTVAAQPIINYLYPSEHVVVPSLVGENVGEAERTAISNGFALQESYVYDGHLQPDIVASQADIGAGGGAGGALGAV
jgi:hypothetical protein